MIKRTLFFGLAAGAALATGACDKEKKAETVSALCTPSPPAPAPQDGDWSKAVAKTAECGFRMGNPDAKVKLVEYGSMTCPHCAEFEEKGVPALIQNYVKNGQVSFEFRNFVRDPADMAASLIARCGGTERFFPLTRELFESQMQWAARVQSASPEQYQAVVSQPQSQLFVQMAQLAGLQQWAAQRGLPSATANACLADEAEINRLVQVNSDAVNTFSVPGTPAFVIDGDLVENAASWEALEPALKEALK